AHTEYLTGGQATSVATGDFIEDGRQDAAVIAGSVISVLLGNGDGTFATHVDYDAEAPGQQNQTTIRVADFDGDGHEDIIAVVLPTGVRVLEGIGDGTFRAPVSAATTYQPQSLVIADLDNDGLLDLVATE